jgi:hypothetical protein
MAGTTNTGIVNYISNPVASFPKNSITVDIFGNTFYRDYDFGAGDDTGVYWNDEKNYSKKTMLFFAISMEKSLLGKFSYGKKLRSSQSLNFKMKLPIKNNEIDFDFMESFIAELEAERIAELEAERIAELEAYLLATGLKDYTLTVEEQHTLDDFENGKIGWGEFELGDLFEIKGNPQLNKDSFIFNENGEYPYFTRTVLNNGIAGYVEYLDDEHKIQGNCLAVGMMGMQFFYMEKDFYAGQFTKRAIPKSFSLTKRIANYFIALLNKQQQVFQSVLVRNFVNVFNNTKIQLPMKDGKIDFEIMNTFISAIQKLVIKDVVLYADKKIEATKTVVSK